VTAKILYFPGVTPEREPMEVEVADEDFDTVRAAVEEELGHAVTDIGQCETEVEWLATVNALIEALVKAAWRKTPVV
jgi:hypothetical protein